MDHERNANFRNHRKMDSGRTSAPMAIPLIKPTIKKIRFPDELTAASALLPKKFPTIRESAVLYNC